MLILVALGCFDSYKIDYSQESAFVFVLRSNEKSAPVFAGWLRTRGVRIHSFRDLIKAKTRPSSARMEFWRGTAHGQFKDTVTAAGEHLGQTKKYLRVDENGLRLLV
jgi:hypothetical protein